MSNMTNQALILEFVQTELLGDATRRVEIDDELLMDGVLDSLGVMRLVSYLEAKTGSAIPAEDVTLENFRSIRTIAAYIAQPGSSP